MASGHHGDSWTKKPAMRDDKVSPLTDHKIMLIRPQQALPLARNNSKLLIFNNIFFNIRHTSIIKLLSDLYQLGKIEQCIHFFSVSHFFKVIIFDS